MWYPTVFYLRSLLWNQRSHGGNIYVYTRKTRESDLKMKTSDLSFGETVLFLVWKQIPLIIPSFTDHIIWYVYCGFHIPWWYPITPNASFAFSGKAYHKLFLSLPLIFISCHIDPSKLPMMSSSISCSSPSFSYLRLFCLNSYVWRCYWSYAHLHRWV